MSDIKKVEKFGREFNLYIIPTIHFSTLTKIELLNTFGGDNLYCSLHMNDVNNIFPLSSFYEREVEIIMKRLLAKELIRIKSNGTNI